jgi:signal transduction histidine kinase
MNAAVPEPRGARAGSDPWLDIDHLPDAVVVADGGLTVTATNRAARVLLGSEAELVGLSIQDALPLRDEAGRDWWECLRPVDGLATRVRQPERVLTIAGRDGERDAFVTMSFVRDSERRLSRLVVCLRDTAARDRSERSASELVATVAHELRSPLTGVKGFTQTLLTRWDRFDDDAKKHMLTTINFDADRVTRLIGELLDVSRIEVGRLELRRQVVDIEALVQRDIASRVAAGEPEERFVVRREGELPELWADPDKLSQVVGNLVENAVRHGAGTVSVVLTAAGDATTVTVTDEGEGIAPDIAARVFRKFWQGSSSRRGTGLGLFIAKGIVDAHGGTIEAGSTDSGGARLRFVLPAGAPHLG